MGRSSKRGRPPAYRDYNDEQMTAIKLRALELRKSGLEYVAVAEIMKVSRPTVVKWCRELMRESVQEAGQDALTIELERLNSLQAKAFAVMDVIEKRVAWRAEEKLPASEKDLDLYLKANARAQSVSESRRKLLGLDAAEKVEVTQSEETEAERKLKDMIRQQQRRNYQEAREMRGDDNV